MKIYFDNVLINDDYYTQLSQDRILFNEGDTFSLGSTICTKIKLGIDKRIITSQPTNVRIEIDNKVYGNYIVDNIEENDYEYVYNLTDKMINFNFNYSAKELIDNSDKEENGAKYVYLYEILEDMCTKANIELATTSFLGSTKHISWYDNRITAREYLSYIAELNGGYAIINKNGKLELRQYSNIVKQTISTEECDNFKLGLEHKIQRVVFDFNTDKWEKGTGETLYINPNNVFITSQEDVNNIYEKVNNLTFYTFKVNYSPIYDVETGECIEFKIGTKRYPTFAQYSLNYNGGWIGGYKFDVASSKQQETTIKDSTKQDIKSIRTELDRTNAELKIIAEKTVDITNNASGIGTLNITNSSKGILHKLDIYGTLELPIVGGQLGTSATKVGYSKVGTSLVKAFNKYIKPLIVGQFNVNSFKIIIKQGDNTKEYIIDDMKNLYQIGTIHDTFEYLDGKCSITRRIGLNNDGTKYILDTPYVEQLKDLNIEVPEGDYTISSNYELNLDVEYLTKNEYTDAFAKQVELQSEINVRSDEIELLSKKKVNNDEVIASINLTPEKAQIDANKISLKGKEIDMTSDNININSTNFKVDKDGNCTANSFNSNNATITGGKLTLNDSGATINASVVIKNNILGYDTMTRLGANGMVFIDNDNDYNLTIDYDKDLYKGHFIRISGESSETLIESDMVQSPYFNQVSLKEYKKDFEKLDNALSIIKNTDIYKYHLKSQDDKEQKHIGLVIGDEFKYSKEILSPKQNGVDLYSMISTCFKAIQEQQEQIEKLEKRIKELERNK